MTPEWAAIAAVVITNAALIGIAYGALRSGQAAIMARLSSQDGELLRLRDSLHKLREDLHQAQLDARIK